MNQGSAPDIALREVRCLVAIVDTGTLTDAAIELGISQAAVSRNLASLEAKLGAHLVRRTTRRLEITAAGERVLRQARRVLAGVDEMARVAPGDSQTLRLGYAWSALGRHTVEFQRRWAASHLATQLELVQANTPTAGLAEGTSDLAILRRSPDPAQSESVLIGVERRVCAMAADDAWAPRRSVLLSDIGSRSLAIDARTGSTVLELWPEAQRPTTVIPTASVDDWLTLIASGRAVGMTSEATMHQYRRPGIAYRPVRDASPIPVYVAWMRGDPHPERAAVVELLVDLYRAV